MFIEEVNRLPIVVSDQEKSHLPARIPIAQNFFKGDDILVVLTHLLPFNEQQFTVNPEFGERFSCQAFSNCIFIFMMRKNQVTSTGMNIHGIAKEMEGHGSTLYMPAGTHIAEFGLKEYTAFQLREGRALH